MNKLNLMVCPHDTARNPEGWSRLVHYLSAHLDRQINFAPCFDFTEFHQAIAGADLVYANPTDALGLLDAHGFCPLARPATIYDEALLIAGPDGDIPAIEAIHGAAVATVAHLLPTRLALRALRERGITPSILMHRDSWLSVVRSVWNGEAPFGILYRDAYDELSPEGREMVRVMEATHNRSAFHMFCARPALDGVPAALTDLLVAMGDEPDGSAALAGLRILAWLPVTGDDLLRLRELML